MQALLGSLLIFDLAPILIGAGMIYAGDRWNIGPRSSRAWRGGLSIIGTLLILLGAVILLFALLMALLPLPDFGDRPTSAIPLSFYVMAGICAAGPLFTGIALCRSAFIIHRKQNTAAV